MKGRLFYSKISKLFQPYDVVPKNALLTHNDLTSKSQKVFTPFSRFFLVLGLFFFLADARIRCRPASRYGFLSFFTSRSARFGETNQTDRRGNDEDTRAKTHISCVGQHEIVGENWCVRATKEFFEFELFLGRLKDASELFQIHDRHKKDYVLSPVRNNFVLYLR